jgi:hypothetical protein
VKLNYVLKVPEQMEKAWDELEKKIRKTMKRDYSRWVGRRAIHKISGQKFTVSEHVKKLSVDLLVGDNPFLFYVADDCNLLKPKRDAKILEEALEHIKANEHKVCCGIESPQRYVLTLPEHLAAVAGDALKKYRGES